MEFENFLEFIYFTLLAILVNFPDQLVTVICNPVLKDRAPFGNGLVLVIIFYATYKNFIIRNLEFI